MCGDIMANYVIPAQIFEGASFPENIAFTDEPIQWNNPAGSLPYYKWNDPDIKAAVFSTTAYATVLTSKVEGKQGYYSNTGFGIDGRVNYYLNGSYTFDGRTVWYHSVPLGSDYYNLTPTNVPINNQSAYPNSGSDPIAKLAWLMEYGGYTGYAVTYNLENCSGSSENPTVIQPSAAITSMEFIPNPGYSFVSVSVEISGDGFPPGTPISYVFDPDTGKLEIGPISSAITVHVKAYGDPYAEVDGESTIPGGGTIQIPGLPSLSATSTGIIGLFAPSIAQMQALSDFMWTDFGGQGTTEIEVLSEIVQAIKRAISNPLDYIIGLNIIPSQGLSVGAAQTVKFGFVSSGISMQKLSNQYFTVDCGTISFPTLCGDTFLDYAPYSKFSIYLPYIGFKELDANDCIGHTIGVYYHGDVVTGGITAYITKDGSVMYQFAGCCALNIPLSADGWGSTIAGAVQIASSVVAAGATGGVAGAAKAAAQGAAAVAANPSLMSPKVSHSGAVSGGAGLMGIQTPFIIREAVRFHSTTGFNKLSGYPAFYYRNLSSVAGYTKVLDLHLHGIPATQDEIAEIESLLKEGVIF